MLRTQPALLPEKSESITDVLHDGPYIHTEQPRLSSGKGVPLQ